MMYTAAHATRQGVRLTSKFAIEGSVLTTHCLKRLLRTKPFYSSLSTYTDTYEASTTWP